MDTRQIYVYKKAVFINGFHFQEGHVSWTDADSIIYAACDSLRDYYADSFDLLIYRFIDGEWENKWVNSKSIPKVVEAMKAYSDEKALDVAVLEAEKLDVEHKLYITDKELRFMETYGRVSCIYAIYTPTSIAGVFSVKRKTTCDDRKPISYLHCYKALSVLEYKELIKESDRVNDEGMFIN